MSINVVTLSGNLGGDAELRSTAGGTFVLSFQLAVNDRQKDKSSGEWVDYTNWITCVLFGNRAQSLAGILAKGTKVAIEGKLRWSQWERDGQKRSKIEVIVDDLELMSPRGSAQAGYAPSQAAQASPYDEDIPF